MMLKFIMVLVGVACLVQGTSGKQCKIGGKECKNMYCTQGQGSKKPIRAVCSEVGEGGTACICKNKDIEYSQIADENCEVANDKDQCSIICGPAHNIYGYLCPKSGKDKYCYCEVNNI